VTHDPTRKRRFQKTIKLHLTVSRDGWISLWDRAGMGGHGFNVELQLTPEQEDILREAMQKSRTNIGDGKENGPYIKLIRG
jgi:hypothetical protein